MRYALTAAGMAAAEKRALSRGLTVSALMERAGTAIAEHATRLVAEGRIVVVTGPGNNGGDGWVAARVLASHGREVVVYALVVPDALEGDAAEAARSAVAAGVRWESPSSVHDLVFALSDASLIIDAVFGFGFRGAAREPFLSAILAIEDADAPVLSVDVPSGIDATTGAVDAPAVHASVTLTFSAPKVGLLQYPGAAHAGLVEVADIGLREGELSAEGEVELWDEGDLRGLLPLAAPDAHKGSRGRLLIVGGSPGLTGAVCLAAGGAQRMGAGYVTVCVPAGLLDVFEVKLTAAVKAPLADTGRRTLAVEAAEEVLELAERADAVVLGSGLGSDDESRRAVLRLVEALPLPLLIDADGLNALAALDATEAIAARVAPTLLTPHPAELGRLLGVSTERVQSDRLESAAMLTGGNAAVLLKGARTVVATADRRTLNLSGGPALATAGTGDVLAGMCGTLLAQGVPAYHAGVLGAFLHGRAGDLAARDLTEVCVTAEDVPSHVPAAVETLIGR